MPVTSGWAPASRLRCGSPQPKSSTTADLRWHSETTAGAASVHCSAFRAPLIARRHRNAPPAQWSEHSVRFPQRRSVVDAPYDVAKRVEEFVHRVTVFLVLHHSLRDRIAKTPRTSPERRGSDRTPSPNCVRCWPVRRRLGAARLMPMAANDLDTSRKYVRVSPCTRLPPPPNAGA